MWLYKITNKINGKAYVGITCGSIEDRWRKHVNAARYGKYEKTTLSRAIQKYGKDGFTVERIGKATSYESLLELEVEAIKALGTRAPNGYNISAGGDGNRRPCSKSTKAKISASHSGVKLSAYHRQRLSESHLGKPNWFKGKEFSEEHRRNISLAKKGKPGQGWIKGRKRGPMSEADKLKRSLAMKRTIAIKSVLKETKNENTIH
jgi:group I intron endonuclease